MADSNSYGYGGEGKEPASMEAKPYAMPREAEDELLQTIRERAVVADSGWSDNHDLAESDVEFAEGINHWPADLLADRNDKGEPCLVLNDMPIFIDRICGEQLQNRQGIHIHPADSFAAGYDFVDDKGQKRSAATVREGIVRQIEYRSRAQWHYDRAHQHAVDGGFGWLRVLTRYASAKDFDQEIIIRSVKNRWSVLTSEFDEPDASDMRFGFVLSSMLKREFEAQYPTAALGDLGNLPERHRDFWGKEARVVVAEYMCREAVERELLLFSNGQLEHLDEIKDHVKGDGTLVDADGAPVAGQDGTPVRVTRRRPVTHWCVYWRKVTAWSILEGGVKGQKLPFSTVPLVPVFGRARDFRDGTTIYSSAIRHAKDTKRMEEFWMSAATSRVALAPKAPWVGPVSAFSGLEQQWERANVDNKAWLAYNDDAVAPPVRVEPATMPVAEVAIAAQMTDRTKAVIGIYDASLGAQSNETSGRAINARDRQSSTSSFVFGDNLSKAVERVGILVNEAIPVVYDTERTLALRNLDDTTEWMRVNQSRPGPDGKPEVINGLQAGEFDVVVQSGPSYVTQRQEAAESQLAIMQAAPDYAIPLMMDTFAENSDWPGADKVAMRARKMMDPKLLTQAEREEMEEDQGPPQIDPATGQPVPPPPDPAQQAAAMQQQVMQADMAMKQAEVQAKQAQAQADVIEAQAKAQAAQANLKAALASAEAQIATAQATKAKAAAQIQAALNPPEPKPNGTGVPSNE